MPSVYLYTLTGCLMWHCDEALARSIHVNWPWIARCPGCTTSVCNCSTRLLKWEDQIPDQVLAFKETR